MKQAFQHENCFAIKGIAAWPLLKALWGIGKAARSLDEIGGHLMLKLKVLRAFVIAGDTMDDGHGSTLLSRSAFDTLSPLSAS